VSPRRIAAAAVLVAVAAAGPGCAYSAARWRDFTDILSLGISAGAGIGIRADVTKLLALEEMAQNDETFYGWHERDTSWTESSYGLLFASWRMPGLGGETRPPRSSLDILTTSRRRTLFPVRTEIEDIRHTLFIFSGGSGIRPVDALNLDVGVSALFGGLEVTLSPGELVDFLLGWFTVDIGRDDDRRFGEVRQELPKEKFLSK
jgi:hypothetical protein